MLPDRVKLLETDLITDGLKPCNITDGKIFDGSNYQSELAIRLRAIAFARLRQAVLVQDPALEIGEDAFGKTLKACNIAQPNLMHFFEFIRETDSANFWISSVLDESPFLKFTKYFVTEPENKLLAMANEMMELGCEEQKKVTDRILRLAEFEEKNILPNLSGTERQVEWGRDIRFDFISTNEITLPQAKRISTAKSWIKKVELKFIPNKFNTYKFKDDLKAQFMASWNPERKLWGVPTKLFEEAILFLEKKYKDT